MSKKHSLLPHTKWAAETLYSIEFKPLAMLLWALVLMGIGDGLFVLADLGSSPWTVLSQGLALQTHIGIGWASFWISVVVMLFWLPLKLKPGLGTLLNIVVIAIALGLTVEWFPPAQTYVTKLIYVVVGIMLFGVGSAFYLTCHMGAGPRDGLMVGLCYYFNWRVGVVRTLIEVAVCLVGFLLGGTVGLATLFFAFGVGWVVQYTLKWISFSRYSRHLTS